MKKVVLFGLGLVFVLSACEMPGVGQATEEVKDQVEGISLQVQDVVRNNETLEERIDNLQNMISSGEIGMPEIPDFDIDSIVGVINFDIDSLTARSDSIYSEMSQLMETQELLIDTLRNRVNNLENEIASLRNSVNTSASNSGGRGSSGASSRGSSGGRR